MCYGLCVGVRGQLWIPRGQLSLPCLVASAFSLWTVSLASSCNILNSIPRVESLFRVSGFTWKAKIDNYFHISNKVVRFVQLVSVEALCKACTGIWGTITADRACNRFQPTSANSCWVAEWRGLAQCEECVPCNFRDNSVDLKRSVPTSLSEPWVHNVCIHLLSQREGRELKKAGWIFPLLIMGPSSALE